MNAPDRLKQLRESRKLTQEELAKALGVAKGSIGAWEQGTRELRGQSKKKVLKYFGLTEAEFYGAQTIRPQGIPSGEAFGRTEVRQQMLTGHAEELRDLTGRFELSTLQLPLRLDRFTGKTELFDLLRWEWVPLEASSRERLLNAGRSGA